MKIKLFAEYERTLDMKTLAALACILGILMTTNTLRSETMDSLTQREKSIAAVAAYSAMGDIQKLKQSLAEGLDCGAAVRNSL